MAVSPAIHPARVVAGAQIQGVAVSPAPISRTSPLLLRQMGSSSNHNEHWKSTVESLDLHGIPLAGMAVFIAYFDVRNAAASLPTFFVVDPFLSSAAFCVVVSRIHMISSIEPDMAAWWDRTIGHAPRPLQTFDYAMEGPWLFLLLAMPFACISPVTFAMALGAWSLLESGYLAVGQHALRVAPVDLFSADLRTKVERYYQVRLRHEALAVLLCLLIGVTLTLKLPHATIMAWLSMATLLLLVTVLEATKNPWYADDLSLVLAQEQKAADPAPTTPPGAPAEPKDSSEPTEEVPYEHYE